ncbi:arginase family protein, partial [Pseudophaeobacter sp.]|uniref:arginase family protein n=1 Tax=Pseudophaeobacter sp. TaxID=1971739 RepID=UPI003299C638
MSQKTCFLIGAPVDSGKRRSGCLMGPDAYRTAGLAEALSGLGHHVKDLGNLPPAPHTADDSAAPVFARNETIAWTKALADVARDTMPKGLPVFLGGDHSLSLGSVVGVADYAASVGRPLFVLWLDAHTDFHTPQSTDSGNLHGTPVGYFTGRSGFDGFPEVANPVPQENVCMIGLRSVDTLERLALEASAIHRHDMRDIDENGIAGPLARFLERVSAANGLLHVSLDVDF